MLLERWPSPVVALNRAVALSMVSGPEAALAELARLERDSRLDGYHYLPAVEAELLRRLGRGAEAVLAEHRALELAGNKAEREYLTERANRVN
jgi:RNA polymerase sigma-70 factor, ECF subfamily